MGSIGNISSYAPCTLFFKCFQSISISSCNTIGNKTCSKAPDVVFFGGTIKLYGNKSFVSSCKFAEYGFLTGFLFKKKSKIGIIACCNHIGSILCNINQNLRHFISFRHTQRIPCRIMGKI